MQGAQSRERSVSRDSDLVTETAMPVWESHTVTGAERNRKLQVEVLYLDLEFKIERPTMAYSDGALF